MVKGGGTQVLACSVCTKCVLLCFVNARNYKGTSGQHVKPTVQRGRYCTVFVCIVSQNNTIFLSRVRILALSRVRIWALSRVRIPSLSRARISVTVPGSNLGPGLRGGRSHCNTVRNKVLQALPLVCCKSKNKK